MTLLRPHRGATILAFGILGLIVCQLFGVAAWVMADGDLQEMERGYMNPSGRELTKTGRILGMVATGMMAISVLVVILFLLAGTLSR